MPRVCLTAAQKEAAVIQARHKRLTDGIKVHKVLHDLTWAQEAERLGVDVRTLRKFLAMQGAFLAAVAGVTALLLH